MGFDILQFWDQLKPDGGNNIKNGDHSFHCPHCGSDNFKVHAISGKWNNYSCDCSHAKSATPRAGSQPGSDERRPLPAR